MFVDYTFALAGRILPPMGKFMYEYIAGANGYFVRAERPGLSVMIPLSNYDVLPPVRGLAHLTPYVHVAKRIPLDMIKYIVSASVLHLPNEHLFYLLPAPWQIVEPQTSSSTAHISPLDPFTPAAANALCEIHTHGNAPAFFSPTDNKDETGFRLYAVLGQLRDRPIIRCRVGVYGHWWEIDIRQVADIPAWLRTPLTEEEPFDDGEMTNDD